MPHAVATGARRSTAPGLVARLRAWLPGPCRSRTGDDPHPRTEPAAAPAPAGQVVAFPRRADALLVRLAELLRPRISARNPRQDLFLLALTREPCCRLRIDHASYVEVVPGREAYRLNVDIPPVTAVVIETTDFDQIVAFVVEYVNGRLAEAAPAGGPT